jgi:two-component system, OmpR family, phosphate regulon response regulator PhoB
MLTEKLLIVDDVGELRKLLRLTLGYGIYQIHEAKSGAEALAMAQSIVPDVVILDVMMPGPVNGLQVCEAIKGDPKLASVYVVILSARGQQTDIEAGRRAGADAYLVKPFRPGELIDVVESRRRIDTPERVPQQSGFPKKEDS